MSRLLVLTDDDDLRRIMEEGLSFSRSDFFSSPQEVLEVLDCQYYPLVIYQAPLDERTLTDFLDEVKNRHNHDAVLLLSPGIPEVRKEELLRKGLVQGILEKPFSSWQIRTAVQEAFSGLSRHWEFLTPLREDQYSRTGGRIRLVGIRGDLAEPFRLIKSAAEASRGLYLRGEPGSGKETLAQVYRKYSPRRGGFNILSCAALTEEERYGFSRGETGLVRLWEGMPRGGIVYIEDIDRCPPGLEELLLAKLGKTSPDKNRALPEDPVYTLIASSRYPLERLLDQGILSRRFLEAWNPETVNIPALRERQRDFGRLLSYFVEKTALELGRIPPKLHRSSTKKLIQYRWPGNVAELEGVIKRAVVLTDPEEDGIPEESFDFLFLGAPLPGGPEYQQAVQIMARRLLQGNGSLKDMENHIIETVVTFSGGSIARAVERSGIPKDRFYRYYKKKGSSKP